MRNTHSLTLYASTIKNKYKYSLASKSLFIKFKNQTLFLHLSISCENSLENKTQNNR